MASLLDVKLLLEKAASDAIDIRITVYFSNENDVSVQSGHIFASSQGMCRIDYRQLPTPQALSAISRLRLLKVAALEMPLPETFPDMDWLPLSDFLALLDIARNEHGAVEASRKERADRSNASTAQPSFADRSEMEQAESDWDLSHDPGPLDLAKEAFLLLEPLFGVVTAKKIDEFARTCSPDNKPHEFLLLCQKHAGIMLGSSRSNAIFKPLYDRLSESRMKRRKHPAHC